MLGKTARAEELRAFVAEGRAAISGRRGADSVAERAEREAAANRPATALAAYREALERGGPSWPGGERTIGNLVLMLSVWDWAACASEARALFPRMDRGPARAGVAFTGLDCALALPRNAPERAAIPELEEDTRAALADPGLHVETRMNMLSSLAFARDDAGDAAGKRSRAETYWSLVADAVAGAPDAASRAAHSMHVAVAAMAAEDPARAIPLLRRASEEVAGDFEILYWLARMLRDAGTIDDALATAERAVAAAYGPRKLRAYDLQAGVLGRKGDRAGERAMLEAAIAYAGSLPEDVLRRPRERRMLDRVKGHLAEVSSAR